MLELATLGLLQGEPLHGYRLKQQLELFMSGCITANYGAIYPMLKRLEEKDLIQIFIEQEGENGSLRKIYSITPKGKARWQAKMMEHPQESWVHARSRFMIKYFFFNEIEPENRVKLLENRLMICKLRLETQEMSDFHCDYYQKAAFNRCQEMIENEINWLLEQIATEKEALSKLYAKA